MSIEVKGPLTPGVTMETGINGNGRRYSADYIISGLEGSDAERIMRAAEQTPQIPREGSRLTGFSDLVVVRRRFTSIGSRQVRATVEYETPAALAPESPPEYDAVRTNSEQPVSEENPYRLTVSAGLTDVETNLDINGMPLSVVYRKPGQDGEPAGTPQTSVATTNVQRHAPTLTCSRLEPFNPLFKSMAFTGRINSTPWMGGGTWFWLCTAITGEFQRLNDGRDVFLVTYNFQGAVDGSWLTRVAYIDPETNQVPADATLNNGIEDKLLYPQADFNLLRLDIANMIGPPPNVAPQPE
jgi:hypothetical protein